MTRDRSRDWRIAYAKQARSDLQARDALLQNRGVAACHQLHFLQMACEKIAKAYLCWRGSDPDTLQSSHAYTAKILPLIVAQQWKDQPPQLQREGARVLGAIRKLARQIELLAPAVKAGGGSPANCEYPWEDAGGTMHIPAEHNFELELLYAPAGRYLIKLLHIAIRQLMTV